MLGLLHDRRNGANAHLHAGQAAQAPLDVGIAAMALDQQGQDMAGHVGGVTTVVAVVFVKARSNAAWVFQV